jgi:hypothetical protein
VLPGGLTVLAIGFKGLPQDWFTQALQGEDGSNDVHVVPISEAQPAVEGTLKIIRRAHPVKWGNIALAAAGLLLWALGVLWMGRNWDRATLPDSHSASRPRRGLAMHPVKVREYGSDDERETFLANGDSITLGRRQDLPFDTDSAAVLTRENGAFRVAPKSPEDRVAIVRGSEEIPVKEPTVLRLGDLVQIDGTQIEVDFSASEV